MFDSCYGRASNILFDENIVIVEGKLSIREDEDIKIVANSIRELKEENMRYEELPKENNRPKMLSLDITGIDEETKVKLRGAIRFFGGDKNNIAVQVTENRRK